MSLHNQHMLPTDQRLLHRAAAQAALTATTVLATIDQGAAMATEYTTRSIVESIDIASNDELYQLVIEVSDDNFTTVNEVAAIMDYGATEVRQSGAPDSAVGDEKNMHWSTVVNGVPYQYWRARLIIAGTSPSIGLICHSSVRRG